MYSETLKHGYLFSNKISYMFSATIWGWLWKQ